MSRKNLREVERLSLVEIASQQLFAGDNESQEALDYLVGRRRFKVETLKEFSIGYVPSSIKNDDGDRHELAGKIIYPIINQYGELVAVSSRDWREGAYQKFWHESFEKPFYLYGFHIAKKYVQKYKKVILVEGEHDAISMHQGGIKITCGILGSAPQVFQIGLLMRYCSEVYTIFDSDEAGDLARDRLDGIFKNFDMSTFGVTVHHVKLPSAKELSLTDRLTKTSTQIFTLRILGQKTC